MEERWHVEVPSDNFADDTVFKLYMSDVGILLHALGVSFDDFVLDALKQVKGLIAENFVACEIAAKDMHFHYWRSTNTAEVDFLMEDKEGVIPIEVKAADNVHAKSLNIYREKYRPPYSIRISNKNFGLENHIKAVPNYAVFCLGLRGNTKLALCRG